MNKVENTISRTLQAIGQSMAYSYGEEGQHKVRTMAEEYMVRYFPRSIDAQALSDSGFWHVYEMGHRGNPRYRLFKMVRTKRGISIVLKPAKLVVPLSDDQQEEGPTGRKVTKRYRFPARPWVFEYRKTMVIKRRNTKFMWPAGTFLNAMGKVPPLRGPIIIKPGKRYQFKLRETSRLYFKTDGRMHMNAAAKNYARAATASAQVAARRAAR